MLRVESLSALSVLLDDAPVAQLLEELVNTLQAALPEAAYLARVGYDEFAVLLSDVGDVLASLQQAVDAVRKLYFVHDGRCYVTALNIGAVPVPATFADDDGAREVLREAAAACFEATEAGRNQIVYAQSEQGLSSAWRERLAKLGEIEQALDASNLALYYEDVVRASDCKDVVYRELLLRVPGRDGVIREPSSFIRTAERHTLMGSIDRWVLREALTLIAAIPDDGVRYALNVSGQSLSDPGLRAELVQMIDASDVRPGRLCFELTETAAVTKLQDVRAFMRHLAGRGCQFALDDFGTGMASFAYLRDLAVHYVKIDGRFVRGMLRDSVDRCIVSSINSVSHELGLQTIAEHVDRLELVDVLRDTGVDLLQGHALTTPRPLTELTA